MLGFILGVVIAASPIPQSRAAAACPREPPRLVASPGFIAPYDAHPTNTSVRFLIDIGSDGRVRRWALTDTSGDPALDAAAGQALAQFRFAAPTLGCVTMSTVIPWSWAFRPDSVPSGAPASGQPAPTASPVVCGAPFVAVTRLGLPPRRETPGTATVDVSLSADARVTAVHLATSSGIKKTDYAATIAARRAAYEFVPVNGCRPVATVYRLELTFR